MEPMVLVECILWIIVIIALFFFSIFFLKKRLREIETPSKFFFLSVFFFFTCTAIQRVFSLIFDFFYADLFLLFIITLLNLISAIPLLYHLEKTVIHSKHIFSIIVLIFVGIFIGVYLSIGYDRYLMYYIFSPAYAIGIGVPGLVYLYLLVKSSGSVRSSVFLIIVGISLVLIFWSIHGQFGRAALEPATDLVDIIGIIAPIGYLTGLVILAIGFTKKRV